MSMLEDNKAPAANVMTVSGGGSCPPAIKVPRGPGQGSLTILSTILPCYQGSNQTDKILKGSMSQSLFVTLRVALSKFFVIWRLCSVNIIPKCRQ